MGTYKITLVDLLNKHIQTSFKAKASIFFGGEYDETLATTNLDSPENAVLLAPEWMSFFDNGQIIMQEMLGEVCEWIEETKVADYNVFCSTISCLLSQGCFMILTFLELLDMMIHTATVKT